MQENIKTQGEWETVQPKSDLWSWEETPILEGVFVNSEKKINRDGREFYIYTIAREGAAEHEDGNDVKILGSTVLDPRFANCAFGTKVKIEFLGMKVSGAGNSYRDYRVEKWKPKEMENIDLPEDESEIDVAQIPF